jgi:hypothetical protein
VAPTALVDGDAPCRGGVEHGAVGEVPEWSARAFPR